MTTEAILYRRGCAELNKSRRVTDALVCEEALLFLVVHIAPRVDGATARAARFEFHGSAISAIMPNGHRFIVSVHQSETSKGVLRDPESGVECTDTGRVR